MQLHYLLVVVVVSDVCDVKVMSSAVAVISAITWVVNNYNIWTELHLFEPNGTKLLPNQIRFFKNQTKMKNLFHRSLETIVAELTEQSFKLMKYPV